MKKIIIIVAAVLVVGGAAAFFLLSPKAPEEPKTSFYEPGDYFVSNIKGSDSLLKIAIELAYEGEDEKQAAFLEEQQAVIRNEVLFILREKTKEELSAADIQTKLGAEIVSKLNEKLGIDYIKTIYFNEYVLQ
jgi:flagellar FliL protein